MAIPVRQLQTAGFQKRTAHGTTGEECCVCGIQTAGLAGVIHVAIDHTTDEFVTDEEAAARGGDVSLYPIGPECVKKWGRATGGTSTRLRRARAGEIIAYGEVRATAPKPAT